MKSRWSLHKSDIRKKRWNACGLTKHFGQFHQLDMEQTIAKLKVTLLDHIPGPFDEQKLLRREQDWMHKLGTYNRTGRVAETRRRRRHVRVKNILVGVNLLAEHMLFLS